MPQQPNITREIEIKLDLASFTNYLKLLGFLGQIEHEENQQRSHRCAVEHPASGTRVDVRTDGSAQRGFLVGRRVDLRR